MPKLPSKAKDNVYCISRLNAAKNNKIFSSREKTAELLNISIDSLNDYELNQTKKIPAERVIDMSVLYKDSSLLNDYCTKCNIGKKTISKIDKTNTENIYKFAIEAINILQESDSIKHELLNIKNNKFDNSDKLINFFTNIEKLSIELKTFTNYYIKGIK